MEAHDPGTPSQEALGVLETNSFAALVEAADAMAKAADVTFAAYERVSCAYVSITCRGDVASVRAAIEAGAAAASRLTTWVATHLIARPHAQLETILPIRRGSAGASGDRSGDTFVCYC